MVPSPVGWRRNRHDLGLNYPVLTVYSLTDEPLAPGIGASLALTRPAMVPPTLSGEGLPVLSRGQVSRCFIHVALVNPHPCGRVAWCSEAQYYGRSVIWSDFQALLP